jgi:hypothetical protein
VVLSLNEKVKVIEAKEKPKKKCFAKGEFG